MDKKTRTLTKWGFYEPKTGILPFKEEMVSYRWNYTERNEYGRKVGMVRIFKSTNPTTYGYTVIVYDADTTIHGFNTTLRRAMIKSTNAYHRLKDRV